MLAKTHLPPVAASLVAAITIVAIAWYWRRLASSATPSSRRRVRRASLALALLATVLLARAAGFVDPEIDPRGYVLAWLLAIGSVFLVVVSACIDIVNNLRLHAVELEAERRAASRRLGDELRRARQRVEEERSS